MNWKSWGISKSPWLYHVNTGSCNNCDIEIVDCLTPKFDVERFGGKLVGSPRHADVLMVTGPITRKSKPRFERVLEASAKPFIVAAVGTCACSKGMFHDAYNCVGPVRKVTEAVDEDIMVLNIPGCPPRPEAIIDGLVTGLNQLKEVEV
jgi:membrane-bound hydrogenase subunit mbhJ